LVLHLLWQLRGEKITAQEKCALTMPSFLSKGTQSSTPKPGPPVPALHGERLVDIPALGVTSHRAAARVYSFNEVVTVVGEDAGGGW